MNKGPFMWEQSCQINKDYLEEQRSKIHNRNNYTCKCRNKVPKMWEQHKKPYVVGTKKSI